MSSDKIEVCGVAIDRIDLDRLLETIDDFVRRQQPALVNYINVHGMNLAASDAGFRQLLNQSDVLFCDGFGVKLGARILGQRLGQRMTPPDWIDELFTRCAAAGHSVYFVGDERAVVEEFAHQVTERHPELSIAGVHDGYFELDGDVAGALVRDLRERQPDVIVTGMGMPRQERWAAAVREELGHGVYLATGALFRWYTGHERRAPRWMTDRGLEWLARVVTRPRRLWRRYLVGNPRFLLRVLRERLGRHESSEHERARSVEQCEPPLVESGWHCQHG